MTSILDDLWHEIRAAFDRLPVWLPNASMMLGDVGIIGDGGWLKRTSLAELRIPMTTEQDAAVTDYKYASANGASVDGSIYGNASNSTVAGGTAGITVQFSRAGAVVLQAASATARRIANLAQVERAVLRLDRNGRWQRDWVLVTEVVEGGPALVIVSGSNDASAGVELDADTGLGAGIEGQANGGIRIQHARSLAASFTTVDRAVFLWRGRYLSKPWLGRASVRDRGPEPSTPIGAAEDVAAAREGTLRELEVLEDLQEPLDER